MEARSEERTQLFKAAIDPYDALRTQGAPSDARLRQVRLRGHRRDPAAAGESRPMPAAQPSPPDHIRPRVR